MSQTDPTPVAGAATPLVDIRGLTKVFGGTRALSDVDLRLDAGTIHALLGQNGAGKSTLIKILAGVYTASDGTVRVEGHDLGSPEAVRAMAFIHQDLGLVESASVAENIALGTGFARRGGLISWKQVRRQGHQALQVCAAHLSPDTLVADLSRADRSLVAIARALAQDAQLIVLDEPTASLPAEDSERLFEVLRRLRDGGRGVLYISHRLDEVFRISDRATVLRDGKVVAEGAIGDFTAQEMVHHIVGRAPVSYSGRGRSVGEPVLELVDAEVGAYGPVSLTVRAGEVLGMTGLTGAGHMQIGRALAGALSITAGRASLGGEDYAPGGITAAVRSGVGFVTSNRMEEGCAPELTNRENLMVNPGIRDLHDWSWMAPRSERRAAHGLLERYGVRPPATELPIATLSGGNQQKIMIGRWLSVPRRLLILEEPTSGVDVGAKADIYVLLDAALDHGLAVLLLSTDFEEVATACGRALVFVNGRVAAELTGDDVSVERLTAAAASAPSPTKDA